MCERWRKGGGGGVENARLFGENIKLFWEILGLFLEKIDLF